MHRRRIVTEECRRQNVEELRTRRRTPDREQVPGDAHDAEVHLRTLQLRKVDLVAIDRRRRRPTQRGVARCPGTQTRPLRRTRRSEIKGVADIETKYRRRRLRERNLVGAVRIGGPAPQDPRPKEVASHTGIDGRRDDREALCVEELHQREAFADRDLRRPGDRARLSKRGVVAEDRVAVDIAQVPRRARRCCGCAAAPATAVNTTAPVSATTNVSAPSASQCRRHSDRTRSQITAVSSHVDPTIGKEVRPLLIRVLPPGFSRTDTGTPDYVVSLRWQPRQGENAVLDGRNASATKRLETARQEILRLKKISSPRSLRSAIPGCG